MPDTTPAAGRDPSWSPDSKWVRVIAERPGGMVEFEFAVGEPELYVEMVMPRQPFEEFCAMHRVTPTFGPLPCAPAGTERHEWDWNLREARERHFRQEP